MANLQTLKFFKLLHVDVPTSMHFILSFIKDL